MQNFSPIGNNLIVEKISAEEKTSNGIYAPTETRQTEGYVVSHNPNSDVLILDGTKIHFTKIIGTLSDKFIVVALEDVIAVEN